MVLIHQLLGMSWLTLGLFNWWFTGSWTLDDDSATTLTARCPLWLFVIVGYNMYRVVQVLMNGWLMVRVCNDLLWLEHGTFGSLRWLITFDNCRFVCIKRMVYKPFLKLVAISYIT